MNTEKMTPAEAQSSAEPILGFARVIRDLSENLGRLLIKF
jgi:hypothetical protein